MTGEREGDLNLLQLQRITHIDVDEVMEMFIDTQGGCLLQNPCYLRVVYECK